jgi:hypothetical protein
MLAARTVYEWTGARETLLQMDCHYPSLANQNLRGIANAVGAKICTSHMQLSSFTSRCGTVRAKQHHGECGADA